MGLGFSRVTAPRCVVPVGEVVAPGPLLPIRTSGCGPEAVAAARLICSKLLRRADIVGHLRWRCTTIVIIPANRKLTDLPEFFSERGMRTFDARRYETLRGAQGLDQDGAVVVAMSEENLLHLKSDRYPATFSTCVHELAHAILDYGLDSADHTAIYNAYAHRKTARGPWTDTYASSNIKEYFAQATTAYFSVNAGIGKNGPQWLAANDPELYRALVKIYPRGV